MANDPKALYGAVDRRLYAWAATGAVAIVFAGFARTYYLKGAFDAPSLSSLVHLHGIVMTSWFLLFLAQVRLVAARRAGLPLGDMLVFASLVGTGLLYRSRPEVHRRLMLLSSVGILTPAIARLPLELIRTGGPLVYFGLTDMCVLLCVAFDTLRNGRLHPAFGWGSALIVASQPSRLLLAGTAAWMMFATWLVA